MPRTSDETNPARPTLAVVLEGGLVQAVVARPSDDISVDILVIDYDTDGADDDELSQVPQGDGTCAQACVRSESISAARIDLDHIVDKATAD